ncbi:hypothetical protein V8E55_003879 [Tylopilus felleus]
MSSAWVLWLTLLFPCTPNLKATHRADSEHHDPEPEIDDEVIQSMTFSPQVGPSHAGPSYAGSLKVDIDVVQPMTFLPQAGLSNTSSLEADIDVIQPTTFSSQAGPSHASSLEADIDVVQPMTFLTQAGPSHASSLEVDIDVVQPMIFSFQAGPLNTINPVEHVQHAVTVYTWKNDDSCPILHQFQQGFNFPYFSFSSTVFRKLGLLSVDIQQYSHVSYPIPDISGLLQPPPLQLLLSPLFFFISFVSDFLLRIGPLTHHLPLPLVPTSNPNS